MPISFIPIGQRKSWTGYDWSIDDEDELASLVAHVALGQYRHVLHILAETNCLHCAPAPTALAGAKKLLTATNEKNPWHRDGWLFQVISWIAANLQDNAALIAPPHMIHAHKGFDGLHVQFDEETGEVISVVICEEKATGKPRKMITEWVWAEFEAVESGRRDNELVAEVSTLIGQRPDIDTDRAVEEILWKEARAFRIAITVGEDAADEAGRRKLFKGYEKVVVGKISRRRAETLYLDDLRKWMNRIAAKAIKAAEAIEAEHV